MLPILLITRFFPPESGAAAERMRAFAYYLADKRPIIVLTTMQSYPMFRTDPSYRWKLFVKEAGERDYITIYRFWTPQFGRGLVVRTISELSFVCIGAVVSLFLPRTHKVIVSSPPFVLGLLGVFWKYIRRTPYILDVRDLYPDALLTLTRFNESNIAIRLLRRCERWFYRASDSVLTVSQGCVDAIVSRTDSPVQLIPNGIDTKQFDTSMVQNTDEQSMIDSMFDVGATYVGVYAGNIGRLYDFEPVLAAAEAHPECAFIIIGDGPEKKTLVSSIEHKKLKNVFVYPSVPFHLISLILRKADFGFVFLKDMDISQTAIPNKLLEYAYVGLPVWSTVKVDDIFTYTTLEETLTHVRLPSSYVFPEQYIRNLSIQKVVL